MCLCYHFTANSAYLLISFLMCENTHWLCNNSATYTETLVGWVRRIEEGVGPPEICMGRVVEEVVVVCIYSDSAKRQLNDKKST